MSLEIPEIHPYETIHSLCSRISDRMNYPKRGIVQKRLFGSSKYKIPICLPNRLSYLVEQMGNRMTVDILIYHHTVMPLFVPFYGKDRLNDALASMLGAEECSAQQVLGLVTSEIRSSRKLRYCPICVQNERQNLGYCYWHVEAQLSGIHICPVHEVWYEESNASIEGAIKLISAENAIQKKSTPRPVIFQDEISKLHYLNAVDAFWLLVHGKNLGDEKALHERYIQALAPKRFASYTSSIHTKKLTKAFLQFFPEGFLLKLDSELAGRNPRNWLSHILKHGIYQHPIRHLLLFRFLGITAEEFFELPKQFNPFGSGPWPCLNPVCDYFEQPVIQSVTIGYSRKSGRRPLGTFHCVCGFTYSRCGPDKSGEDIFRVGRVCSYGSVWETRLKQLWHEGWSAKHIGKQMGCYSGTVLHHAVRLGLKLKVQVSELVPTTQIYSKYNDIPTQAVINSYRNKWIEIKKGNPSEGASSLQSLSPKTYSWLDRHDHAWLNDNKPRRKISRNNRSNWSERDSRLVERVIDVVEELRSRTEPAAWITRNTLAQELDVPRNWFGRDIEKLPQTAVQIRELVETSEQFVIRRLQKYVEKNEDIAANMTPSQLIKKVGISQNMQTTRVVLMIENITNHPMSRVPDRL